MGSGYILFLSIAAKMKAAAIMVQTQLLRYNVNAHAKIPQSELVFYDTGGHAMLSQADPVRQVIGQFLSQSGRNTI